MEDALALLTVTPDADNPSRGRAHAGSDSWPCALGRSGVADNKIEGDGITPAGEYPLRRLLYRADRLALPRTGLRGRPIGPHDGWCDDPQSPSYNRWVRIPNEWRCEKLWREDGLYDLVVPVGYNDDPPVPDLGSAIFLHVARAELAPTEGCVAFARTDLLAILRRCTRATRLRIEPPPGVARVARQAHDDEA
jgi:L,D-peptidoglycan transpeptidase YkuD (ErfK/YbiS/YcfS/YnhG family)